MILNSFNPYFNGYSTLTWIIKQPINKVSEERFNPCFNGYSTLTPKIKMLGDLSLMFQSLF